MTDEKIILIGCDDDAKLAAVQAGICRKALPLHSMVTVTSASGFFTLAKSLQPSIIMLCFRNNLRILSDYAVYVKKKGVPFICFLQQYEQEHQYLQAEAIVFTFPLDQLGNKAYLQARINSIVQLQGPAPQPARPQSLAAAAIQQDQLRHGRNLSRYVLELDQKVEILSKIKERIQGLYPAAGDAVKKELLSIINVIKSSLNHNELWEDFKRCFEETDPFFLLALVKKYPFLTPVDIKYCCYMRMNMSNDDIKNIFCISLESVRTHKYRLKKKMQLPKEEDLRSYLRSVG